MTFVISRAGEDSVDISRQQAVDVLHKWQDERRLVQGGILQSNDGATSGFLGRIERLDNSSLAIDARSLFMLGDRCGLTLPLQEEDYSYSDWRDVPEDQRDRLRHGYDSALFIVIAPGWHIELYAAKLNSEGVKESARR
jgi:hypothetical protein